MPEKIAVLGGGAGALSAVFELTSVKDWREKYDITVYQLGWRLGGKGASGRNPAKFQRIEEHGLHIWFGSYDNAFNMMQRCYNKLGLNLLDGNKAAFVPHTYVSLEELHEDEWENWIFEFPRNDHKPGDPTLHCTPLEHLKLLASWLVDRLDDLPEMWKNTPVHRLGILSQEPDWLKKFTNQLPQSVKQIIDGSLAEFLQKAHDLIHLLTATHHRGPHFDAISWLLQTVHDFWCKVVGTLSEVDDKLRRINTLMELALVIAKGLVKDVIFQPDGYEAINDFDLRQWLKKHGANDVLIYSGCIRGFYDACFAYPNGKTDNDPSTDKKRNICIAVYEPTRQGNLEAGSALHAFFRMTFEYRGSLMWKMTAGMGDIVFAPLYLLLKQQGVKFKFFHKVVKLIPDANNESIEQIQISRQVNLEDGQEEYDPLIYVKDMACWPNAPLKEQLAKGIDIEGYNLESYWTPWQDVEPNIFLKKGEDFDRVVLGISIGALKEICDPLQQVNNRWRLMLENIKTVQSQSFQLWLREPFSKLGWPSKEPVITGFVQPFATWADMSQTLEAEEWSDITDASKLDVAYFCAQLEEDDNNIPPSSVHNYPQLRLKNVISNALKWHSASITYLWRNIGKEQGLWDMLAPESIDEQMRFDWQYFRANIDPSERYVLSVAGSSKYRLKPGESGFSNLYLAGDWTWNIYNLGAVESAVISGRMAAQALSGQRVDIIGVPSN
jgi:uncharacterized protein with NAD-binding domain and iron-sulfur cluster